MRVRIEPPLSDWPVPADDRPIVTGHQQTLFHPGILAKYLAADVVTRGRARWYEQVVVDQDVYEPLAFDLPVVEGDRLTTRRVRLGRIAPDVPVASQPPIAFARIARELEQVDWPGDAAVTRDGLFAAFEGTDTTADTLARQAWLANDALLQAIGVTPPQAVFATELLSESAHGWVLDALRTDAAACARHYNAAVKRFPGAGIAALRVEPFLIETPLWALGWMKPRRRVFVDVADREPIFVTDDGEPIEADTTRLAPRALLMTALLRRPDRCAAFVHGTGGWAYDRITEQWWRAWRGQALSPMTLATADVHLEFGVPVHDEAALRDAVWMRHHIRDNVDRYLDPADAEQALDLIARKRDLLAHMDDDRDKRRRREAFDAIHAINAELRQRFPEAVRSAEAELQRARQGVANRAAAARRDWFFGLYPSAKLGSLREAVASAVGPRTGASRASSDENAAGCQGGPPEAARPSP